MSQPAAASEMPSFDHWKEYPTNLDREQYHLDLSELRARLASDANRLFVSDSDSRPQLLSLNHATPGAYAIKPESFTSAERLDLDLASISLRRDLRVFYLVQAFSWSRLLVSEDHCRKLLTYLKVHPAFLDILHTSGEKIGPVEESFAAQFARISPPPPLPPSPGRPRAAHRGYELGYNIKYVERHGRKLADPFSLRETGVYQKWDAPSAEGDWIFMQPSASMKSLLEAHFPQTAPSDAPYLFQLHAAILAKASSSWRPYINHLEDAFSKIVDRGFYTNVRGPAHDGDIDADFSDIRRLQILTDKLQRLSHVLHMNTQVGLAVQDFARRLRAAWAGAPPAGGGGGGGGAAAGEEAAAAARFEDFDASVEMFLFQHRAHRARIDSILQRADGISGLVRTILNFRDVESNQRIVQSLRDATLQGVMQNRKLERLSRSSAQDTKSMMIIALITTIFLPATFVATFFGSNFFGFQRKGDGGGDGELQVAANVWIYVVVTFVLLVFT
ncbi:hypothetical protein B2J93_8610 [Marssonina coronariae]|uniref:CorA-like transporter domain-containing protein n=1 Tax=Diplocarpon coronariae TaxID=2795749 RepID=A0A218YW28_9HELO|nr:hypothetical protein B2J93_8610 [Marssonina coronariae]